MLKEKISKHLGKPYVYLPDQKKFLCQNGVLFSMEEYKKGININAEYERREKEDMLYDYAYAKSTGLLRKKRSLVNLESKGNKNCAPSEAKEESKSVTKTNSTSREESKVVSEVELHEDKGLSNNSKNQTIAFICLILLFTSVISGYISTLHTATYLCDYVDMISAWLMSSSVTAYNATAFEVSVIFKHKKRYGLTFVFIMLWSMVTLFSMTTTVSVFYDRFNFMETQTSQENKQSDANKLALELLKTKEKDLRESITFKKKDIEYRQERDYATTAVRLELESLQKELQVNLSEQQSILRETPEIIEKVTKRKESLFAFLGRILKIEGGILEFTMSTLSAIFVNLISPLSLVAVTELSKKRKLTKIN
jgi:hypothetical protein